MAHQLNQAVAVGLKNSNTANEKNPTSNGQVNCKKTKDYKQNTTTEKFNRLGVIVEFEKTEGFFEHKAFEIKFNYFETILNSQKIHIESIIENNNSKLKMIEYFKKNILADESFVEAAVGYLVSHPISDEILRYSKNKTCGVLITVDINNSISIYVQDFLSWEIDMQYCEKIHGRKRIKQM